MKITFELDSRFDLYISDATALEYGIKNQIINNDLVAKYNLLRDIFLELRSKFNKIKLVEVIDVADMPDIYSVINIASFECYITGEIDNLLLEYECCLDIPHLILPNSQSTIMRIGQYNCHVTLLNTIKNTIARLNYLQITLEINNRETDVYILQDSLIAIYTLFYPAFGMFEMKKFYLELIINWIRIFFAHFANITVVKYSPIKLKANKYGEIELHINNIFVHLLFSLEDVELWSSQFPTSQNKPLNSNIKIPFSVLSHMIDTSSKELDNLEVGDVLMSTTPADEANYYLDTGNSLLSLDIKNNKFVITGVQDKY